MGKVAKLCDMLCVAYGKAADVCFSGGSDGNVFIWSGITLQKTVKAHEGPVFAMHSLDKVGTSHSRRLKVYYSRHFKTQKANFPS